MGCLRLQEGEGPLLLFSGPKYAGVDLGPAGALDLRKLALDVSFVANYGNVGW
jgi:hypothetical protein